MQKRKKYFILLLSICIFLIFTYIVTSTYFAMKADSEPTPPNKILNILTWKHIPTSILDGFQEKYPDYTVNVERYSKNNYISFLKTKLESDASVDIIEIPSESYYEFATGEYLQELTNQKYLYRFTNESIEFLKDLSQSDDIYGIPYLSDYLLVWYNKAIFDRYDIDVPDSIDSLMEACNVLQQNGIPPLSVGLSEPDITQVFLSALLSDSYIDNYHHYEFYPDAFASLNNTAYLDALTNAYNLLANNYITDLNLMMTQDQAFQTFLDNNYAMAFTTESATSLLSDSMLQKIDIGVTGIYVTDQAGEKQIVGSPVESVMSICRNSAYTEISNNFLDYYTQYETVRTYIEETKYMTNIQNYAITNELSDSFAAMKKSPTYVYWKYFYFSPFMENSEYRTLAQKIFYNIITPQTYTQKINQIGG